VWEVLKRQASASRVFVDGVLSIFWSSISRGLGRAIEICRADCDTEIIETVWDYAGTVLRLCWDCDTVLSAPGRDYAGKTGTMDWEK